MRLLSRLCTFLRAADGAASVEIVVLFPLMLWPFLTGMEAGVMQMRRVMFEYAVDVVARDVRMGISGYGTAAEIRAAVCETATVIPDCESDLMLDLSRVDLGSFTASEGAVTCRNRDLEVQPATTFKPGTQNELMLMRFCVLYDPIFPGVGIGARMDQVSGGGVAMVTETFFVNEP
ncbi:Flp pilus assembly protein TadG [Palleronia marisminoris]|uniref:TadE-like protein n=1 Tax=Palleronia marisminoris TaxID=315423 RepID=A0A1Y5RER0_9RHOB|nr:hypothetical protein [Palleronia marisminoris]SFG15671.1 Flp pilus assembly protein TadG [Palleronia marisminoris]SLN15736.1 hypothetical protein PAM7066_00343 [Palleronia marisminoris]